MLLTTLILAGLGAALLIPFVLLFRLRGKAFFRAMIRLRDRIDRSQRWP